MFSTISFNQEMKDQISSNIIKDKFVYNDSLHRRPYQLHKGLSIMTTYHTKIIFSL